MLKLTENQIKAIHFSWIVIKEDPEAMLKFYDYLFELAPETRHFFDNDLTKQSDKLKLTFEFLVDHLEQLEYIKNEIEKLGKFHNRIHIESSHYTSLKIALLKMIEENMGDKFSSDINQAWSLVLNYVSEIMISTTAKHRNKLNQLWMRLR